MRRVLASTFAALTLALGAGATTAAAQTTQNGLVNINLENITVQVPVGLAANVCDVNVAVIARLIDVGDRTRCTAVADATAQDVTVGSAPSGATTQNGLINVNISNVTIQVPIAVALNVCDVNVAILAVLIDTSDASCDATATSGAG
jgi:hypothetical protein